MTICMHVRMQGRRPDNRACVFVFKIEWRGLEHACMASRGSEVQRLCKRDQPINAYVWRDIYSVGDRKQDSVRERNVDGETTDRYRDGDAS